MRNDLAYAFPGQGAQEPGMGADLLGSPLAKKAGEILGLDLAAIMREGPAERLQDTAVCQPAIFLHSALVLEAMKARGLAEDPAWHFGLSLGEYTALYAAGVMTFEDTVAALQVRGRAMQEACRASAGGMASVLGLEDAAVEKACAEARGNDVLQVANYNSPGQVVVSGTKDALARLEPVLKAAGAKKVIPLKVAGGFHSPLMEPAKAALLDFLRKVSFRPGAERVVANVTARPHRAEGLAEALAGQLTGSVRLAQTVSWLHRERGVAVVRELGTGKVICGLIKRIEPGVAAGAAGSAAEVQVLA